MIEFLIDLPLNYHNTEEGLIKFFVKTPEIQLHYNAIQYELIVWGDPILDLDFKDSLDKNHSPDLILNRLKGHYYFILNLKSKAELYFASSFFNILPIYYCVTTERLRLSDNVFSLGNFSGFKNINRKFILEMVLFNYPLFNSSIFVGINLLSANSFLVTSKGRVFEIKHTHIEQFFNENPIPLRKSLDIITENFLNIITKYFDISDCACSLTAGFDGRTLVSAGLRLKKDFSTFAFGNSDSEDRQIARALSEKAGLIFNEIGLDYVYVKTESFINGHEFMFNSSGTASFSRAHYLYSAKKLSKNYEYILTGNFGSEIFRAAHIPGVMISHNLYHIFNSGSLEEAIRKVEKSYEFKLLSKTEFKDAWESLQGDIVLLPCFNKNYKGLTKNQQFYVFVFEELFRKYFGAEVINQFKYLKNRTPYLDIDLLKMLLKTKFSGIHSDFFENNPFKRYKGQVFYASFINKNYPEFGSYTTDKGYKPDDLVNLFGKVHIAMNYFKKRLNSSYKDKDPYCVYESLVYNQKKWGELNPLFLNVSDKRSNNDIDIKLLSLSYILKRFA